MKTIDIGMVGPRGVGKTSLLASMYNEVNRLLQATQLKLVADDHQTSRYLEDGLADLRSLAQGSMERPGPGIRPSFDVKTLEMSIQVAATGTPAAEMRWTDYPGEALFPGPGDAQLSLSDEEVHRLQHSPILLIAIDAPSLMAEEGRYNDQVNKPFALKEFIDKWLASPGKQLVVFTPIKCEAWVQTPQQQEALAKAVQDANAEAITNIRRVKSPIAIRYMPVQTVGCVRFNRYDTVNGSPVARFMTHPPRKFSPQWVGNPLQGTLMDVARWVKRNHRVRSMFFSSSRALRRQLAAWESQGFDDSVQDWSR